MPAYNEAAALRLLIPDIGRSLERTGHPFQICVVDDGSKDDSRELLSELGAQWPLHVLCHEKVQGYGAALRACLTWALARGTARDVAITMDADNTHPPRYLEALTKKISEGFDIVTASYSIHGGSAFGLPPLRRLLSASANLMFRLCRPTVGVRTYTNGFRAYRLGGLQTVFARHGKNTITENGFPGGTELFLKALEADLRPAEIPFELHYENRGRASKMTVFRTSALYARLAVAVQPRG